MDMLNISPIVSLTSLIDEEVIPLDESSLAKMVQYATHPDSTFAVISVGIPKDPNDKEALKREAEQLARLKAEVRRRGYGYIELDGAYRYDGSAGVGGSGYMSHEPSLLIPNLSKEEAVELGGAYKQESVVYKSPKDGFGIMYSSGEQKGKAQVTFDGGLDISDKGTADFFSALKRGSHRGCKFIFK